MSLFTFDDIDTLNVSKEKLKPFFTLNIKDEKELLKWLNQAAEGSLTAQRDIFQDMRANLVTYRGLDNKSPAYRTSGERNSEGVLKSKSPRLTVNHLYEITENLVSKMNRLKPAVEVLPTNDEYTDKNAAKAVKFLIEHLWYINDVDRLLQQLHRIKYIAGEAYLFITWDRDKGDLHPDYVAARKAGLQLDQLDGEGNPLLDEVGNPKKINIPVRTGDVKYEVVNPWHVLLQGKKVWEDVEWIIKLSSVHVEELKKEYPDKADDIKTDSDSRMFDSDLFEDLKMDDHAIVFEFLHKHHKFVPQGRRIKFIKSTILENEDLPYSHGGFPCERMTDIDMPTKLRGMSFFEMVKELQSMHNNLSNQIAKNHFLVSSPKWMMPRGAAKIDSLGNDVTIVQYQGPVAPQLVQMAPTPPEVFRFREQLKEDLQQLSGVHGISRGQPPAGVTAAVAMQFLNEQELERATSSIAKHNNFVRNMAIKTVSTAADYYDPTDGRLLRIVGKDNAHILRALEVSNLHKDYDIRINTGAALPQSKAGKLEKVIQTLQFAPDLLSPERWVELLDFGSDDKMVTLITAAIRAAEAENEDILSGTESAPPEEWEEHLIHWQAHVKAIQSRFFKEEVPEEIRHVMMDHIELTEWMMSEKAKKNPLFEAQLAELPLYPIFYKDAIIPRSREQMEQQALALEGASTVAPTQPSVAPGEQTNAPKQPGS